MYQNAYDAGWNDAREDAMNGEYLPLPFYPPEWIKDRMDLRLYHEGYMDYWNAART